MEGEKMDMYKLFFEESNDPYAIVTAEGLKFVAVNGAFVDLVGISEEEMMSLSITDLKDKKLVVYIENSGQSIADAAEGKITHGQSTIKTKTKDRVVMARDNYPLFDEKGKVVYIKIVYRDITALIEGQEFFSQEIGQLVEAYRKAANGNLRVRYKISEPNANTQKAFDELAILRDVIDEIVGNLRQNVEGLQRGMGEISQLILAIASSVSEISNATDQLASDAEGVNSTIQSAGKSSQDILKAMESMSIAIAAIANETVTISGDSERIEDLSNLGLS